MSASVKQGKKDFFLSVAEVAKILRMSTTSLYKLLKEGTIPCVKGKLGTRYLIPASFIGELTKGIKPINISDFINGDTKDAEASKPSNEAKATEAIKASNEATKASNEASKVIEATKAIEDVKPIISSVASVANIIDDIKATKDAKAH